MENVTIRLALAVDHEQNFRPTHFGDAYQYLIYEWDNGVFQLITSENNPFKNQNEEGGHSLTQKGRAIIDFLKEKGVNVLVSKQFGLNIKLVNQYFIPIVIYSDTPEKVLSVLSKHMRWIEDEILNNPPEHKLFTINKGIMKSAIKD
ncbi:MAG: hypothetical protein JXR22_03935 [Prolixibacteraceae bacterium]|nr:hypothetical protein [Prolixibacteraceae bacterium]